MDVEAIQPRFAAGVGLLALIPTMWYAFGQPSTAGFVAAVNVLIIFTALWITMGPIEDGTDAHDADEAGGATT